MLVYEKKTENERHLYGNMNPAPIPTVDDVQLTYLDNNGGPITPTLSDTYRDVSSNGVKRIYRDSDGEYINVFIGDTQIIGDTVVPVVKRPIGGRIFYDDGDNGATYKFYDANDVEVVYDGTIQSLMNATQYEVSGTPTKDRFYVFNNELVTSKQWGKQPSTIGGSDGIGQGKINTQAALQQTGWEDNSIFQYIIDSNTNELGGCSDWYIGSMAEQEKLDAVKSTVGIYWDGNFIWSSVEKSRTSAYGWNYSRYSSSWDSSSKNVDVSSYSCFAQRSF